MAQSWMAGLLALAISAAAPFILRPLLRRLSVVDVPNDRSSHVHPVLRGGGLGPLFAFTIAMVTFYASDDGGQVEIFSIGLVALAAGILGWLEDLRGLRVAVRAGLQLALGFVSIVILSGSHEVQWWLAALGVLAVAGYINVANFMDGVNGMSSFHGIVVGAAFAALGILEEISWLAVAGIVLAASFAGFLPWNVRGRLFLGDVGSYLLGAAIAVTAVSAVIAGLPVLAVCGPVVIYLADTSFTLARRVLRGERWTEAHRSHVYQRLTNEGLSHVVVSGVVATFSAATFAAGLASLNGELWSVMTALGLFMVLSAIYLCTPRILNMRSRKRSEVQ